MVYSASLKISKFIYKLSIKEYSEKDYATTYEIQENETNWKEFKENIHN